MKNISRVLFFLVMSFFLFPGAFFSVSYAAMKDGAELGVVLPLWSVAPFVGILLSIALVPLVAPRLWHHHFPKISAFWAVVFIVPFLFFFKGQALHEIIHMIIIDYIPFILLLWSLFTVAGGIYIKGSLKGTPAVNTVILLIGTMLASVIGTTGASMLLIRPILRSNSWRAHKVHTIVFFIFLVSNIGGSLTPLGDPPLFLGFLHGVPFFWTLNLFPKMAFASAVLLLLYFIMDSYYYKKEIKNDTVESIAEPLSIKGCGNFIFLAGIIAAVLFSGTFKLGNVDIFGVSQAIENLIKDVVLIFMGCLSLIWTSPEARKGNEFSWAPIMEVAYLFAGIFITIVPALAILKAGERGALDFLVRGLEHPQQYFWLVGCLSSFLDNAPTYLTFFSGVIGKFYPGMPEAQAVSALIVEKVPYLMAISTGAVFMGANTYIGNAPNFMVKSIAEEAGVNMPTFFGYILKYSLPILIVLFLLMTFLFY